MVIKAKSAIPKDRVKPPSLMAENEIDIELERRGVKIPLLASGHRMEKFLGPKDKRAARRTSLKRRLLWAARIGKGEHVRKHKGDEGQKIPAIPSLYRTDRRNQKVKIYSHQQDRPERNYEVVYPSKDGDTSGTIKIAAITYTEQTKPKARHKTTHSMPTRAGMDLPRKGRVMITWLDIIEMRRFIRTMGDTRAIEDYLIELMKFKKKAAVKDEIDFWLHEPMRWVKNKWVKNDPCPRWNTKRFGWERPRADRSKPAAPKGGRQVIDLMIGTWSNCCYHVDPDFIPLDMITPTGKPRFYRTSTTLIPEDEEEEEDNTWNLNVASKPGNYGAYGAQM